MFYFSDYRGDATSSLNETLDADKTYPIRKRDGNGNMTNELMKSGEIKLTLLNSF